MKKGIIFQCCSQKVLLDLLSTVQIDNQFSAIRRCKLKFCHNLFAFVELGDKIWCLRLERDVPKVVSWGRKTRRGNARKQSGTLRQETHSLFFNVHTLHISFYHILWHYLGIPSPPIWWCLTLKSRN